MKSKFARIYEIFEMLHEKAVDMSAHVRLKHKGMIHSPKMDEIFAKFARINKMYGMANENRLI